MERFRLLFVCDEQIEKEKNELKEVTTDRLYSPSLGWIEINTQTYTERERERKRQTHTQTIVVGIYNPSIVTTL